MTAMNETPEPAPSTSICSTMSLTTSAITQVPMAKYPPESRNARKEIGSESTPAMMTASGTARNGSMPKVSAM
ncbi:unannotated protein [freshwater metagenome]|uniref:Unannotated protein n=1 Tax=freshwater metagenome TaxID=449393 RepID=A0A6J7QW53_9ZZZZ